LKFLCQHISVTATQALTCHHTGAHLFPEGKSLDAFKKEKEWTKKELHASLPFKEPGTKAFA
jgi:hypothetical protein